MFNVENINAAIAKSKQDFEWYITNTSYPLVDRWGAFVEAPDYLKNHQDYYVHYTYDGEDILGQGYDRHETVRLQDIVEGKEDDERAEWDEQLQEYVETGLPESEELIKFKEWVLSQNLGSFRFDW